MAERSNSERRLPKANWSIRQSADLYQLAAWGAGYFGINDDGHVEVRPQDGLAIDLHDVAAILAERDIRLPALVRLTDLVRARVGAIDHAFHKAIADLGYAGGFHAVYPIKVNQAAHVVTRVVEAADPVGLEAGSKPELQVVLAANPGPGTLIICNGYKDRDYVRMAILAGGLGVDCVIVIDRPEELDLVLSETHALGIEPLIGVRARLGDAGAERAKFGLSVGEIVRLVDHLDEVGHLAWLQLLHFHIGSQVTRIEAFENALDEAGRIYVELVGAGANMRWLDVGGGLAVDHAMDYDLDQYAAKVVSTVAHAVRTVRPPILVTEAGRATLAHGSVLLFDVLGVNRLLHDRPPSPPVDAPDAIRLLAQLIDAPPDPSILDQARRIREGTLERFRGGLVSLRERAEMENWFWHICHRVDPDSLTDTYYCNFSVFQSIPDSWAIDHVFPVMPIHRLDEEPDRRAVLVDLTCDSDGTLKRFIDGTHTKSVLELHAPGDSPYILGLFLVGAYQESLGDLHNLFGDTNVVHVRVDEDGVHIDDFVAGDVAMDVLGYLQYDRGWLIARIRDQVNQAVGAGRLAEADAALLLETYERGLDTYTYLKP